MSGRDGLLTRSQSTKWVVPETDAAARWELAEADAAFGWIPPEALKKAHRLRWLQNPDAGPFAGYFYPDLIDHPVIVCNPRGIYFDHISHHVMMFVLALVARTAVLRRCPEGAPVG